MEEKQTRFADVQSCLHQKAGRNAVPESTKMSTKHAVNVFEGVESYE